MLMLCLCSEIWIWCFSLRFFDIIMRACNWSPYVGFPCPLLSRRNHCNPWFVRGFWEGTLAIHAVPLAGTTSLWNPISSRCGSCWGEGSSSSLYDPKRFGFGLPFRLHNLNDWMQSDRKWIRLDPGSFFLAVLPFSSIFLILPARFLWDSSNPTGPGESRPTPSGALNALKCPATELATLGHAGARVARGWWWYYAYTCAQRMHVWDVCPEMKMIFLNFIAVAGMIYRYAHAHCIVLDANAMPSNLISSNPI